MKLKTNTLWITISALALVIILVTLIRLQKQPEYKTPANQAITTTFYPYYNFISYLTKDNFVLNNLSSDPKYILANTDQNTINNSSLLIYTGLDADKWLQPYLDTTKIKTLNLEKTTAISSSSTSSSSTLNTVINASSSPSLIIDTHSKLSSGLPWLSPRQMLKNMDLITSWLGYLDNGNRDVFNNNFKEVRTKLIELDNRYYSSLRQCRTRSFATTNGYMSIVANDYNLDERLLSSEVPKDIVTLDDFNLMLKKGNVDDYFQGANDNLAYLINQLGCTTITKQ